MGSLRPVSTSVATGGQAGRARLVGGSTFIAVSSSCSRAAPLTPGAWPSHLVAARGTRGTQRIAYGKESDMNVRYRWIMGCLIAATTVMAGCGRHGMGPRIVD